MQCVENKLKSQIKDDFVNETNKINTAIFSPKTTGKATVAYLLLFFFVVFLFSPLITDFVRLISPSFSNSQLVAAKATISQNKKKKKSKAAENFQVTWYDIAFANFFPVPKTRLADFSKMNFGGMFRVNFMVAKVEPLWLSLAFLAQSHISNTYRIDSLTDYGFSLGLGWRLWFPKPKSKGGGRSRWSFTPRVSYGFLLHVTYGDYYNDYKIYPGHPEAGIKKIRYFSDSFFLIEPEFAVDVTPRKTKKIRAEIFFSPSFKYYPEKKRHGYEYGYVLGFRLKTGSGDFNAVVAGKVVDAESGLPVDNALTLVSQGVADETSTQGQEQFAYQVSKKTDYILTVTAEGYQPASVNVSKEELAALAEGERKLIDVRLQKLLEWGVYGNIYLHESKKPLQGVKIYLQEESGAKSVSIKTASLVARSDFMGAFRVPLKENTRYTLFLQKDGYFVVRGHFDTSGKEAGWYPLEKFMKIFLQKALPGEKIDFDNIYYDSGKWDIRPESLPVLNSMTEFFMDNPTVVVELSAHTDSRGSAQNNKELSQKRAQSAVDVIIGNGVPSNRITPKGYGEEKILNGCVNGVRCSSTQHQVNRRTEFRVKGIMKAVKE